MKLDIFQLFVFIFIFLRLSCWHCQQLNFSQIFFCINCNFHTDLEEFFLSSLAFCQLLWYILLLITCGLYICSCYGVFDKYIISTLMKPYVSIFSFQPCIFKKILLEKFFLTSRSQRYSAFLRWKFFVALMVTFKSLIHLELIFV